MSERLYVVMNRFNTGEWMIADFWGLPFASAKCHTAHKMRREIECRQKYHGWKYKKSRVVRVEVRP